MVFVDATIPQNLIFGQFNSWAAGINPYKEFQVNQQFILGYTGTHIDLI